MNDEINTLKEKNKKLLKEKDITINKLKNHIDLVSSWSNYDNSEGLRTVHTLEQQINSLVKSITRAENIILEKDSNLIKLESANNQLLDDLKELEHAFQKVKSELTFNVDRLNDQIESEKEHYEGMSALFAHPYLL